MKRIKFVGLDVHAETTQMIETQEASGLVFGVAKTS